MTSGVFFDLDGTLVDTAYLHTVSWWQAFRQYQRDVGMARIHRAIGMEADRIIDHLLGPGHDRYDDDNIRAAHNSLYAQYWWRVRPTPGARELLQSVAERGLRAVITSSASRAEVEIMLAALDAHDVIDTATSLDDAGASTPAPNTIQVALDRTGLCPAEVVFVGDSVWDVHAAGALAIPCIGLTCGGISAAELLEAGAVRVYDDPRALLEAGDGGLRR
ncbi:HAD family hydrolase [Dactylosporangium vinaceum]|uniref:HAD family hydrolase n=1 Tax=Dactylosporangium vinaceum TaxID=53362 RepID=A0ABV5MT02_9ACTN|nr:HAD family hydrolase [Dactylosporangium vinaceum]UAB99909.1 HAD family hydrolase [Dactylosporangium vinaceum]